ncbi:hypothetical protein [Endozoicomonas sp. 8E]|nr:hypothetical protein [Endozoicomonas sp. 8E]WOG25415.1 hypothetical protein P6910_12510 [Endozoicomonas sp. 8E]
MNWLTQLNTEHTLYSVADECIENTSESYYLIIAEQKQESHPDD